MRRIADGGGWRRMAVTGGWRRSVCGRMKRPAGWLAVSATHAARLVKIGKAFFIRGPAGEDQWGCPQPSARHEGRWASFI
jgi:hypothetical protein